MAENNLSKKEQMIYDYMKELMRVEFPDADLSDNGAFMETFGIPHVELLTPLVKFADRITLKQSIENADMMSVEEMDELGRRYYTYRDPGDKALGYATFVFLDIPTSGILSIRAGIRVTSKDDLGYRVVQTVTLNESQLVSYYDPDTFRYRIPVQIEAEATGKVYNAEIGSISNAESSLPDLEGVTNEIPITGGRDAETNVEFAKKIEETSFAPNLGINRGYNRFIRSFPEVEDVVIAGYGHPLMKRDIIGEFVNPGFFHQTVKNLHWGTKIDIYLRGRKLVETTEYLNVEKNEDNKFIIRLSKKPVYDITEVRYYSDEGEQDNPDLDPNASMITSFVLRKEEDSETQGTLNENVWIELNDSRLTDNSNISVRYRYNSLLEEIHNKMYEGDKRPPTADVLAKQANEKYVYGGMVVKMNSPLGLRERDKSWIRQQSHQWIKKIKMGQEIQFSDITIPLTVQAEDSNDPTLVDYIKLPFQIMVLENNNKYIHYCLSAEQRKVIEQFRTEKPYLFNVFERYKDYVTTYEFFDILHAFTFDSGLDEALAKLDFLSYEWGQRVAGFKLAKEIMNKSFMLNRLSPTVHRTGENEYFELGDLFVYEDREYGVEEWKNSINSIHEIALMDRETDTYFEPLELTLFCITIIYILTTKDNLEDSRENLYQFLSELVERTPIGHDFNI